MNQIFQAIVLKIVELLFKALTVKPKAAPKKKRGKKNAPVDKNSK